nr:envelope protein [Bovine retrovirus CH15]
MVLFFCRMENNNGSRRVGFKHGGPPAKKQLLQPPRFDPTVTVPEIEIPYQAFCRMTLGERRRKRPVTVPLPTWGQIKKLSQEAFRTVMGTGKVPTPENLFLAMCAILTVTSSQAASLPVSTPEADVSYTYWAYIPNPPLLEATVWGVSDILIYTTPHVLSPPWKNLTYLNKDDGRLFNFSQRLTQGTPICLTKEARDPCLVMDWQSWLLPGRNESSIRARLQRLTTWSINNSYNNISLQETASVPFCTPFTYISLKYKPFIWSECTSEWAKRTGDYINWGPFGMFFNDCSEWNNKTCLFFNTTRLLMPMNQTLQGYKLMWWGDGGVSNPRWTHVQYPDNYQSHLWKVAAALQPVYKAQGQFLGTSRSFSTYNFFNITQYNLTACIPLPYLFLVGNFMYNEGFIQCNNCALYSCLNASIDAPAIMILQQRMHLWLPVKMEQPWASSPLDKIIIQVLKKVLHRSKRFIGAVIATVLSLIAIVTVATVSSVALSTAIQNKHFLETWHQDSFQFWTEQTQIDARFQQQIDILKQSVQWLGRKMIQLEKQISLKCHWNSSTFCITPILYNKTESDWVVIQHALEGNMTAVQLIDDLQKEVNQEFGKPYSNDYSGEIADDIFKHLEKLNPFTWGQSLIHSAGSLGVSILILIISLILIYRCCIVPLQLSLTQMWTKMLISKKKKGGIEDAGKS